MTVVIHDLPTEMDEQAERHLLGAAVWCRDQRSLATAFAVVDAEDLVVGRHVTVWEGLWELLAAGLPLEPAVLADHLDAKGHLDAVKGPVGIMQIWDWAETGADLVYQARRIAARARRRRQLAEAINLAEALADPTVDADAAVHTSTARLLEAGRGDLGGLITARSMAEEIDSYRNRGSDYGLRSSWKCINRIYRPTRGQLTVLTGVPSQGKSTWLDAYLLDLASSYKWRTAMFSPERRHHVHAARMVATHVGRPLEHIDDSTMREALAWIDERFVWIDDGSTVTIESLLSVTRLAAATRGLDGLVVDPWNWIEPNKPRDVTTAEHIGRSLAELMRFAQRRNMHVWVVAHPTKMRQHESGSKQGAYQVPRPYDISESAGWFNRPDWCLCVWRDHLMPAQGEPGYVADRDPHVVDVYVQKARDDDLGRVGVATLRFVPQTRRYVEIRKDAL